MIGVAKMTERGSSPDIPATRTWDGSRQEPEQSGRSRRGRERGRRTPTPGEALEWGCMPNRTSVPALGRACNSLRSVVEALELSAGWRLIGARSDRVVDRRLTSRLNRRSCRSRGAARAIRSQMRNDIAVYSTSALTAGSSGALSARRSRGAADDAARTGPGGAWAPRAHVVISSRAGQLPYPLELVPKRPVRWKPARSWAALENADGLARAARPRRARRDCSVQQAPRRHRCGVLQAVPGAGSSSRARSLGFTLERMSGRVGRALCRLVCGSQMQSSSNPDERERLLRSGCSARCARPASTDFADRADHHDAQHWSAFIWYGRLVSSQRPMLYVELHQTIPEARFRVVPVLTDAGSHGVAGFGPLRAPSRTSSFSTRCPMRSLARSSSPWSPS